MSKPPSACDTRPLVRVGLPYVAENALLAAVRRLGAPVLISTGALWRKEKGLMPFPAQAWTEDMALDSGGFVAMLQGGYRWTAYEYVEWLATNGGGGSEAAVREFPFAWWSAMDYCCEPEIAKDRDEVQRRIDQTVESYAECFEAWLYFSVDEGFGGAAEFPEPMPIVQGRRPEDYVRCCKRLAVARAAALKAKSTSGWSYEAELGWEGEEGLRRLPTLLGVGSVCRREVAGVEGIVPVLEALDAALPPDVKLHLFGVKGETLSALTPRLMARLTSIDSMAWDKRAQMAARERRKRGEPLPAGEKSHYNVPMRAATMTAWYEQQQKRLTEAAAVAGRKAPVVLDLDALLGPARPKRGSGIRTGLLRDKGVERDEAILKTLMFVFAGDSWWIFNYLTAYWQNTTIVQVREDEEMGTWRVTRYEGDVANTGKTETPYTYRFRNLCQTYLDGGKKSNMYSLSPFEGFGLTYQPNVLDPVAMWALTEKDQLVQFFGRPSRRP